jgi:hypothetical protein
VKQIKNRFSYFSMLIFISLLFATGCQKEVSSNEMKNTNQETKTSSSTISSIVYTDVNPDSLLLALSLLVSDEKFYYLDLNHDGTKDYVVETGQGRAPCFMNGISSATLASYSSFISKGSNSVTDTVFSSGIKYPVPLNLSKGINQNSSFSQSGTLAKYDACRSGFLGRVYGLFGLWSGVTNKYLGLRLVKGSSVYYGWIRMDVATNGRYVIIKDYAYNSLAGRPILAGQTK